MARPKKQGLDYFTKNVNFYQDIKIRKLIRHKGIQAVSIYEILLCQIYAVGYYLEWDDDLPFIISEVSDLQEDYIDDVIHYMLSIGLLDQDLYDKHHILTSHGIQERFFDFCNVAKRKVSDDIPYLLVNLNEKLISSEKKDVISEETLVFSEETGVNTVKTPINSVKSTQSKVKESKVKKNINTPLTPLGGNGDNNPVDDSGVVLEDNREEGSSLEDTEKIQIRNRERRRNGSLENNDDCETNDNPQGYEKFNLSFIEEPFREAFFEFMEYKRSDQRFKYKSEKSIKTCYNRLVELSGGNPQTASKIVKQAISNGWKGIFKLENNNYETGNNNNGYRTAEDLRQGVVDIISSRAAASKQPKRELPVV